MAKRVAGSGRKPASASVQEARAPARDSRMPAHESLAGGPANGVGGQSATGPIRGDVVLRSGDDPQDMGMPVPAANAPLSHYKGTSLATIGRDKNGRVIPHKYSSKLAKQVAVWAAGGYNENDICIRLNMRPGQLRELYGKELNHGAEKVGMDVTEHIVNRVKKSDRIAIFYAKARMGWRDGDSKPTDVALLNIVINT